MMKSQRGRHLRGFALQRDSAEKRQALSEEHGLLRLLVLGIAQHGLLLGVPREAAINTTGQAYVANRNNDDIRRISSAD